MLASAAEGFWLLDAPISRCQACCPRPLVGALVLALVGGALVGALVAALTGSASCPRCSSGPSRPGGSACRLGRAFAAQQGRERHRLTASASLLFAWPPSPRWWSSSAWRPTGCRSGSPPLGVEIGALLRRSALVLLVAGSSRSSAAARIRRARLLSGGSLVRGISGAFFALDIGLARDIVVERRAIEIGHVKPKRGQGVGLQALTWRELAASAPLPPAADRAGRDDRRPVRRRRPRDERLTPVFAALALFGALIPMLGGLRVLTRTGGLARCLPFSMAQIKLPRSWCPAWSGDLGDRDDPAFVGFGEARSTGRSRRRPDGDRRRRPVCSARSAGPRPRASTSARRWSRPRPAPSRPG